MGRGSFSKLGTRTPKLISDRDENAHLNWMDSVGITKTILSITDPGTHLQAGKDEQARKLSRECNQFASDLQEKQPDRFGFWAALPLPDVEGSLVETA